MFHKDLIGRYYVTLSDKDYQHVFRADRIQQSEIQGIKQKDLQNLKQYNVTYKFRNTYDMLGDCSYSFFKSVTFYDATYNELISTLTTSADIRSTSSLEAHSTIVTLLEISADLVSTSSAEANSVNVMYRSYEVNNTSNIDNTIINVKHSVIFINNDSSISSYAVKRLISNTKLKISTRITSTANRRMYLVNKINNTSSANIIANSYKKRVKKKYLICYINKMHYIEVVI